MTAALLCQDRSGFLFAHACDRPAASQCVTCHKPICVEHTRMAAAGPTCITCVWQQEHDPRGDVSDDSDVSFTSDPGGVAEPGPEPMAGRFGGAGTTGEWAAEPAASRRKDDPFFYDPASARLAYYDADDYLAFDAAAAAAADDTDTGTDTPETDTGAS